MKEYKISAKTHWQHAKTLFWFLFFALGVILFYLYVRPTDDIWFYVWGLLIGFLVQLIPQMALHIDYYNVNKGDSLEYDSTSQLIRFVHRNTSVTFYPSQIESVVEYISPNLYKGYPLIISFEVYYHKIVTLKDGTRIILTSLMVGKNFSLPNVDKAIVTVKTNGYRWATGPSLKRPIQMPTGNQN